jgi:hypothetical protein
MRTRRIIELILALGMMTSFLSVAQGADAPDSDQDSIGQTPLRLSLTKGEVSFWRTGAEDWSQAQVNTPLAPGDLLYTGPQGNLEIQIGSRAFVRGGPNTQLGLENQEPDFLQFKVTAGNASFDLRTVEPGRTVEVDTPNAAFTIEHAGYYRVDVSGERTSFITRRAGQATVTSAGGEAVVIEPSEEVVIEGTERPQVASYAAPQLDAWDKWNYARTDHLLDALSARYVSPGVYGVDDLDRYGTWRSVPTYGPVWVPSEMPSGWAPYRSGSWMLDPYYGWTWVDTAPWGWAPYHYGRWVFVNGFWAWAPGPVVARPAYAPALVAFLGGPSVGVSVNIGIGPVVGWVALGWGEPCVPWWGSTRIRHRPWWGGWGGPRVVNNVVINQSTIVNVQEINVYRNTSVRQAVVVVNENRFGRGPIKSADVPHVDEKSLRPTHTAPQVTATPASFVPRESHGIRPPEKVLERSVVATRTPPPGREPPARVERKKAPVPVPTPAPRIVSVPEKREMAPALQRPPFGQSKVERRTTDRGQPPAPPKSEGPRRLERIPGGAPPVSSQPAPQTAPQAPARQKGEPQVTAPSPAAPQPSGRRPEADRVQPPAPPKVEGPRRPEGTPPGGRPPVSSQPTPQTAPQAPARQKGEPQVAVPSPAAPQPSGRRPEADRVQPPALPKVEGPRRPEGTPPGGRPPVSPQLTPQTAPQAPARQQREPQVAVPSPAAAQPSGRPTEVPRPPARALPGEPVNRLSPNRGETRTQQQKEQKEAPRPVSPDSTPENAPQKRPGG